MDYTLEKIKDNIVYFMISDSLIKKFVERILNDSLVADYIAIEYSFTNLRIEILNPIVTQDFLISYIELLIDEYNHLERCFKLVSNIKEE